QIFLPQLRVPIAPPRSRASSCSNSLLKNPSPSRVCRDSVFLSRIGGGWHAGRICGSERAVFVYRARDAGATNHPLRKIRELVRDVLGELNRSLAKLYASEGRPSIPPEQSLSALLLQVLYGIRSERQLMEQLDYNLLYRWFVGLSPDDPIWDPTTFTKNRDRL